MTDDPQGQRSNSRDWQFGPCAKKPTSTIASPDASIQSPTHHPDTQISPITLKCSASNQNAS